MSSIGVNSQIERYTIRVVFRALGDLLFIFLALSLWVNAGLSEALAQSSTSEASTFDPPQGFVVDKRGSVTWHYHSKTVSAVRPLQYSWSSHWVELSKTFGVQIPDDVEVRVARDAQEMRALAPPGLPPPPGAIGVAYPGRGIMVLALSHAAAPDGTKLDKTFMHEMVHLALYRATLGKNGEPADIPRWFTEGLAIHLSDEASLERFRKMAIAAWADELIPLNKLSERFPALEHQVTLAYAQSASFVAHMFEGEQDHAQFVRLLSTLRGGQKFEQAVAQSYGVSLQYLEREWRQIQHDRFAGLPILLSGGGIWALGFAVILFGYLRKRKRTKAKLARWEAEEAAQPAAPVLSLSTLVSTESSVGGSGQSTTREEQSTTFLVPSRASGELSVPTVEYDGKTHTLH